MSKYFNEAGITKNKINFNSIEDLKNLYKSYVKLLILRGNTNVLLQKDFYIYLSYYYKPLRVRLCSFEKSLKCKKDEQKFIRTFLRHITNKKNKIKEEYTINNIIQLSNFKDLYRGVIYNKNLFGDLENDFKELEIKLQDEKSYEIKINYLKKEIHFYFMPDTEVKKLKDDMKKLINSTTINEPEYEEFYIKKPKMYYLKMKISFTIFYIKYEFSIEEFNKDKNLFGQDLTLLLIKRNDEKYKATFPFTKDNKTYIYKTICKSIEANEISINVDVYYRWIEYILNNNFEEITLNIYTLNRVCKYLYKDVIKS